MKPLSPRRANEFRERWFKRIGYGDRKRRAERKAWLASVFGPTWETDMWKAAKGKRGAELEAVIS